MMQEHGSKTSTHRSVIVKDTDSPWPSARSAIGLNRCLLPRRVPVLLDLTKFLDRVIKLVRGRFDIVG
jgi:hypothetical protein